MADAWNPSTDYSPGELVAYNGQTYRRSQYPPTPTSGTAPNVEMSVDDEGNSIRTWTLEVDYFFYSPTFDTQYFRLIEPTVDPATGQDDFSYSGPQFLKTNAYGFISNYLGYSYGNTVEEDQLKNNPPPQPDSPVCPADSCGVAMRQFGPGPISCLAERVVDPENPKHYYVYVTFNHPLYFRRTITVTTVIRQVTSVFDPPSGEITYIIDTVQFLPSDTNFCIPTDGSYFTPSNAAFDITVPPDVFNEDGSTVYTLERVFVSEVTPND